MVETISIADQIRARLQPKPDQTEHPEQAVWMDASIEEYWETVAELADESGFPEYDVEYIHHKIHATVSQASDNHETIVLNIGAALRQLFYDQSDIRVMGSNKLIYVPACQLAVNPDVLVMKGHSQVLPRPGKAAGIINPYILIEVHSDSTERNDLFVKFECYKKLDSLHQIIYVSQHKVQVSVFTKNGDTHHWINDDYDQVDAVIDLGTGPLPLADIYHKITFGPAD